MSATTTQATISILGYWEHEGPDDPAGDAELLKEALAMIEQYGKNPAGWKTLEEFEAELAEATHLSAANSRQCLCFPDSLIS